MPEYSLPESERYIMQWFWQHGAMKSDELAQHVVDRGWKNTTLLTFLSRLASKGMLLVQKDGKANLYTPLVTEAEYLRQESRLFLNEMYGGSAKDFVAAMVSNQGLTEKDIAELKAWLDGQEAGDA